MFYLIKVLIGRAVVSLDRPFDYYTLDSSIKKGMRVLVPFASSKETVGFVVEDPLLIQQDIEDYKTDSGRKLSKILSSIDDVPLLSESLFQLAKEVSSYYKSDFIRVLSTRLPPSLKPKNSALKKPQAKVIDFVVALSYDESLLNRNEKALYLKLKSEKDGIRKNRITAKASLNKLIEKKAAEIKEIPVSRIPELEAKHLSPYELTNSQQKVFDDFLNSQKRVSLLQGVTGSGKTAVYISLAKKYIKEGKGVLILIPEIALTDQRSNLFASYFPNTLSILNSSLSDSRKYDEYHRIASGESKVVLGTRSAIFSPVKDLGLIIIDEEHSSSYKQDNDPYYDAIHVAQRRAEIEGAKVLLGSATPRIIDKAKAVHGLYDRLYRNVRYSLNQDKEVKLIDRNDYSLIDPYKSAFISVPVIQEIEENLKKHQQTRILLNRRGFAPIYVCRNCHKTISCPNCSIPLSYHKKDDTLRCHHCGYKVSSIGYLCPHCHDHDFRTIGQGTERAYQEIKSLFPGAKITRLDSDVSNNEVRHEVLDSFADGETDIIIGTQIIAKGHDFPRVSLAIILDADQTLRLPSYLANEETFDLIAQFVGRAGRKDLKGRVLIQTYSPDNKVILRAAKQDYESFYLYEREERRKYQYPPYTYLTSIQRKSVSKERVDEVSLAVEQYLVKAIGNKKFNVYGPSAPFIPHRNGRYYRTILLKYKSIEENSEILDGIKDIRLSNKDVEISINVDPGRENR